MKDSEHFTRVIKEYLNQRAMTNTQFVPNLTKELKSIEECITYILTEVYKSGCSSFPPAHPVLELYPSFFN